MRALQAPPHPCSASSGRPALTCMLSSTRARTLRGTATSRHAPPRSSRTRRRSLLVSGCGGGAGEGGCSGVRSRQQTGWGGGDSSSGCTKGRLQDGRVKQQSRAAAPPPQPWLACAPQNQPLVQEYQEYQACGTGGGTVQYTFTRGAASWDAWAAVHTGCPPPPGSAQKHPLVPEAPQDGQQSKAGRSARAPSAPQLPQRAPAAAPPPPPPDTHLVECPAGGCPAVRLPQRVEAVGRLRIQPQAEVVPEQALHLAGLQARQRGGGGGGQGRRVAAIRPRPALPQGWRAGVPKAAGAARRQRDEHACLCRWAAMPAVHHILVSCRAAARRRLHGGARQQGAAVPTLPGVWASA
jgi:hypothetical protein